MDSTDYDAGWLQWGDMIKYSPAPFHRRRMILQLARRLTFRSVLDVGCGTGELLRAFQKEFVLDRMMGVDLSAGVVEANRRSMPAAAFDAIDISQTRLPGEWDLIVCSEVIEHIADYKTALRHLRESCRGHIIITVPTGRIFPIDRHMGHYQHFRPAELERLLVDAGFRPLVLWRWGFPWHTLYKYLINLSPEVSLNRFSGGTYSASDKLVARLLTAVFYLNSKRFGSQLIVAAEVK